MPRVRAPQDPLPPEEQQKLMEQTLQHFLNPSPEGRLKEIYNHTQVLKLLKKQYPGREIYFNGAKGKPVLLHQNNIKNLIQLSLKEVGVTVKIGNLSTTKEEFTASVQRLKDMYGLKELSVAPTFAGEEDRYPPSPGRQAAGLFTELVQRQGAHPVVGIGGGRTLRQMTFWLPPNDIPMTISAINYVTRPPDNEAYDSSYLAMNVHWLCNQSKARILSLPPLPTHDTGCAARWHSRLFAENPAIQEHFADGLDPDIVFVGTGNFYPESPSISRVYRHLGIDFKDLDRMNPKPAGDINLSFFDQDGNDITGPIITKHIERKIKLSPKQFAGGSFFKGQPFCHPFLVGMNIACFKDLVKRKKTVILVAGGEGTKTEAIHTLLRSRIVNGLVTDASTMVNLLKKG